MCKDNLEVKEENMVLEDLVISLNVHEKQQCKNIEEDAKVQKIGR